VPNQCAYVVKTILVIGNNNDGASNPAQLHGLLYFNNPPLPVLSDLYSYSITTKASLLSNFVIIISLIYLFVPIYNLQKDWWIALHISRIYLGLRIFHLGLAA